MFDFCSDESRKGLWFDSSSWKCTAALEAAEFWRSTEDEEGFALFEARPPPVLDEVPFQV
jgi:hypothetical protein